MSRIGKQPIEIPQGTEVKIQDGTIFVKGPKGELQRSFPRDIIDIKVENNSAAVSPNPNSQDGSSKALWGTYASHLGNMVLGVNEPYEKKLIVEGVGFKIALQGDKLVMSLGFSHDVEVEIPKELSVSVLKNTITISGIDKELVGQFASKIKSKKKPEPYKGKGIRYEGEVIRRKQGKKTI